MSYTCATPLEMILIPSYYQQRFAILMVLLAVSALILLPVTIPLRLLMLFFLFLLYYFACQRRNIEHLVWQENNHWLLFRESKQLDAQLLPDSVSSSWLVILNFRIVSDGGPLRVSVLVWADAVRDEVFRRLRVRLKLEGQKLFKVGE